MRSVVLGLAFCSVPLHADMVTAVKSQEKFQKVGASARNLLEADDFEGLDKKIEELEKSKTRDESGIWIVQQIADVLSRPQGGFIGPDDWNKRLAKLEEWSNKSNTAFSLSVFATAEMNYAWLVRGDGPEKSVEPERKKYFDRMMGDAESRLLIAKGRNPEEVDIYRHLLEVGLGSGWSREQMDEALKQGIAVAPDYFQNYVVMATYLQERWHGKAGDWQRFVNTLPSMVPGDDGAIAYARTVNELIGKPEALPPLLGPDDQVDHLSWTKIKHGYELMNKAYPDGGPNFNRLAKLAFEAKDYETAKATLKTLEEHSAVNPTEWGGQPGLAAARKTMDGQ